MSENPSRVQGYRETKAPRAAERQDQRTRFGLRLRKNAERLTSGQRVSKRCGWRAIAEAPDAALEAACIILIDQNRDEPGPRVQIGANYAESG
jgi:hypothetical protein